MARRFQITTRDLVATVTNAAVCGALSAPLLSTRAFTLWPEHSEFVMLPIPIAVATVGILVLASMHPPEFGKWERRLWLFGLSGIAWAVAFGFCNGNSISRIAFNELSAEANCVQIARMQSAYQETHKDTNGEPTYAKSLKELSDAFPNQLPNAIVDAELTSTRSPVPLRGYCFKMLQIKGTGNHLDSFAIIGYPAVYGHTGLLCFISGEQGAIGHGDFGVGTEAKITRMTKVQRGEWRVCDGA